MDDGMKDFEGLLREVGRISDHEMRAAARTVARTGTTKALSRWDAKRRWRVPAAKALVAFTAAAALAVAMLIAATHQASPDALSFVVGAAAEPGKVGAWMASPPEGLPLRFSEGTQIILQAGTSARVSRADEHGADVLLERGKLEARVVHRDAATGWMVHAGPFEIRIVGTTFDATWDPVQGSLGVHVTEGRVVVTGPLLDDGRAVHTAESLHVSLKDSKFEMTMAPTPFAAATEGARASRDEGTAPSASASATAIAPAPDPSAIASAAPSISAHAGPSGSAIAGGSGWRDLARTGQNRAALDAAMAAGYDRVISESSTSDLLFLADTARYAGDVGHAKQALMAARGRGEKGRSAFLLGKLAADSSGSPGEAVQWFETYLAEAPGGGLAEQALGRLMGLYKRTGRTAQATAAAQKYIAKYPNGGYASAARSVLGQ